jgi:succinate-semialdehyde dehydrogenase/glutarate-semialdehyde dehydrogenase
MVNETQRAQVLRKISESVASGARALTGGAEHPPRFVLPTVLTGVTPDMAIMREETFGPVACIGRFASVEEAVRLANDTPYGLGAVVFGEEKRALEVARRLDAGMIGVNKSCGGAAGTPWVGAKQSGYGYQGSREGHRQFTQTRVVSVPK